MPFPNSVRLDALVRSGRHCCVCHEFAGRTANVHHIIQEALGGPNTIENAICLCTRCHTEAGHYNPMHPLGTKYSPQELRAHRDAWWNRPTLTEPSGDDDDAVLDAFALGILVKMDDPSLAVLAALAACPEAANINFAHDPVPNVNLVSLPRPQVIVGDFDWDNPREVGVRVAWPWPILKECILGLRQQRLLHFHSSHARGGFGNIYLSELGQTLVRSSSFPIPHEA
ncbi:MAG: HNH endonuclease [Planctomycetota bacterium]